MVLVAGWVEFIIPTAKLELRLGLEELTRVKIHEEVVPELLEKLVNQIRADNVAKDPVIVDLNTLVVLDGMHRVAALEKLGCKYLPVCLVDYRNPHIHVRCWYRVVRGEIGIEELLNVPKSLGLEARTTSLEEALETLEDRKAVAALLTSQECHLLGGGGELRDSYAWVRRIEGALREIGLEVGYETERDARRAVGSGEAAAAIMTPAAKKEEVIEVALSGNLLAHKTTRHVVPARPMGVNVRLGWLTGERSKEEVNRLLIEHLSKRRLNRLPKGSLLEGRRYEEELLVFQ